MLSLSKSVILHSSRQLIYLCIYLTFEACSQTLLEWVWSSLYCRANLVFLHRHDFFLKCLVTAPGIPCRLVTSAFSIPWNCSFWDHQWLLSPASVFVRVMAFNMVNHSHPLETLCLRLLSHDILLVFLIPPELFCDSPSNLWISLSAFSHFILHSLSLGDLILSHSVHDYLFDTETSQCVCECSQSQPSSSFGLPHYWLLP